MKTAINLRHLRAFVAVARHASFTRAAEQLLLSQSALTVTVRQLEEEVGTALLNRTTRNVALTADGEAFLVQAERILEDFEQTLSRVHQNARIRQGKVDIAVVPSVTTRLMPRIVQAFHATYPDIRIAMHDDNGRGVHRQIHERSVEFGISNIWRHDPELEFTPLTKDRFGLVCRRDDPHCAGSGPVSIEAIDPERFFIMAADTGVYTALMETPGFAERFPTPAGEVLAMVTLVDMIRAGLGVTLLPELARPAPSEKQLIFRPLKNPPIMRELCLIRKRGERLSPSARRAWDFLLAHTPREVAAPVW